MVRKKSGSRKSRMSRSMKKGAAKPFGVTKIPKGNVRKLKPGVALVYGTKSKPRFGTRRFKTFGAANKYAKKKGLV